MNNHDARAPHRGRTVGVTLALLLSLAPVLTGCVPKPHFEDSLVSAAQNDQPSFTLPRGANVGAPLPSWDSVYVLCPYSQTDQVPAPFTELAHTIDTSATDSVQWLLFSAHHEVRRISIDRSVADFCQTKATPGTFDHTQSWNANEVDGAWVLMPVSE